MYFPYFRGKQYELIAIRDSAHLMAQRGFVPIIEPVKESLTGLRRTLDEVIAVGGRIVLIVNPYHGDHSADAAQIEEYGDELAEQSNVILGIALNQDVSPTDATRLVEKYGGKDLALIHAGYAHARELAERLGDDIDTFTNVFVEGSCSKLYRRRFQSDERVLLRDGFRRQKNRNYPDREPFSDLHITFEGEGASAFGDFLIVGDDYFETGGPAYAVAIHLTYIDGGQDDEMWICHFKSDRSSTPQDPAGKFAEALEKLVNEVERAGSPILRTTAVEEFLHLHSTGHFPGLGTLKKLSMQHHIETLAAFFRRG